MFSKLKMHRALSSLAIAGCLIAGLPIASFAQGIARTDAVWWSQGR